MTNKHQPQHFWLTLFFTAIVLLSMIVNTTLVSWLIFVLVRGGIWHTGGGYQMQMTRLILFQAAISLPIGAAISYLVSRITLKPLQTLIGGMLALAEGKFSTRIVPRGALWRYPGFRQLSYSFNTLADELENTEMLRSDFVNNFSHEFKTPIVSIAGFAKLVQRGNLTEEQRQEYLQIIENESMRLSYMATNVLNLTKIENQSILTDLTGFNLSEQIRDCILLLVNKWEPKHLEFRLDMDEHSIQGNEELLKQVWINLVHNAIKFTPMNGLIEISVREQSESLTVSVTNHGSEIPAEAMGRIFNKFYQADESHSAEGSGVGLAIVKRVVHLHNGTVTAVSKNKVTTFTVTLPKRC